MEGQYQGMYGPVDVVIAAHRGWHKSMGSHHSRRICRRNTPNDACGDGVTNRISSLLIILK